MNKLFCFFVCFGLADKAGMKHMTVLLKLEEIASPEDLDVLAHEVGLYEGVAREAVSIVNWKRLPGGDQMHGSLAI